MKLITRLVLGAWCLTNTLAAAAHFTLSWTNNLLTVSGPKLSGGKLEIWYPEAFCRKGSTDRDWSETVLPQKTVLVAGKPRSIAILSFHTRIEPEVEVLHTVLSGVDELEILFEFTNWGRQPVDLEWFQPACIRVAGFTGCNQSNYTTRSFIFTERGLTTLDKTDRRPEEAARYHGGQVYVPKAINLADVNPRPLCDDQPVNGLIGCFSADGKFLLATASDSTHELFEGIYVCLHSDPHVGGLAPLETKVLRSRIYILPNDPTALLKRYQRDFPAATARKF